MRSSLWSDQWHICGYDLFVLAVPFCDKKGQCCLKSLLKWRDIIFEIMKAILMKSVIYLLKKKVYKTLFILWQWKRDNLPPTMSCSFKSTKVTKLSALSSGTPWTSKRSLKLQFSTPSSKMFTWKFTMDECKLLCTFLVWKLFFLFMIWLMQQISVKVEPENDKRWLVIKTWWYKQNKCLV